MSVLKLIRDAGSVEAWKFLKVVETSFKIKFMGHVITDQKWKIYF